MFILNMILVISTVNILRAQPLSVTMPGCTLNRLLNSEISSDLDMAAKNEDQLFLENKKYYEDVITSGSFHTVKVWDTIKDFGMSPARLNFPWFANVSQETIEAMAKLSLAEKLAIYYYSYDQPTLYHIINFGLTKDPHLLDDRLSVFIRVFRRALQKIPPYPGIVYRGDIEKEGITRLTLQKFKKGKIISDSKFLSSTSMSFDDFLDGVFGQRNIILIIKSKTGRLISPLAHIRREQEVIFLPGASFRVTKTKVSRTWYLKRDILTVYLEEL